MSRSALIKLAASFPKGSPERKTLARYAMSSGWGRSLRLEISPNTVLDHYLDQVRTMFVEDVADSILYRAIVNSPYAGEGRTFSRGKSEPKQN